MPTYPTVHPQLHDMTSDRDHSASGLTAGNILIATDATTFAWGDFWVRDGMEIMSDAADTAQNVGFLFGTNNVLTESFTSTAGNPTDARYISQWHNGDPGTWSNYRMRLFANGWLQPRNGISIGASPYTTLADRNTMYVLKTNNTTSTSWQVGNFIVQVTASSNRNIRATGFVSDVRAQDSFTGTGSGETSGGWFRTSVQGESTARTYSGLIAGGVFEAAFNRTQDYAAIASTGEMTAGMFRWTDTDTGVAVDKSVALGSFISTEYGTFNDKTSFGEFRGINLVDCTQVNGAGPHRAMYIAAGGNTGALQQNIYHDGGGWNDGHMQFDTGHLWFDGATWRAKASTPTSSTDGFDITAGTGGAAADSFLEWAGL